MFNLNNLKSAIFAVLAMLVASGCNSFENPDADAADNGADVTAADTQDTSNGADVQQADIQADNGQDISQQGTDASFVDAGNPGTDVASAPDVQQVEVTQEVSSTDTAPKAECANDADCNDNNPCTGDICVVGAKCVHVATSAACDDNNACTDNDVCNAGACKGTAKVCTDSNPCTDDFCINGKCLQGVNSTLCDDGNACTDKDKCDATKCVGVAIECDDKNPCTTDTCDKIKGCAFTPAVCEDGDACTTDTCDIKSGVCQFSQKVCDDGKAWTYDWCSNSDFYGQAGQCVAEEKWNGCGKDSDCEDGNKCTINICNSLSGTCKTVYENCNDNDSCTVDSCVPAWGCSNVTIECDDNNPCTTYDYCYGNGGCYGGFNKNCNDSDPSTTDSCNATTGACVHTPISTPTPPVVPPTSGSTIKVEISCGAVACEVHPYFGADVGGKSFDNMGPAQAGLWYSTDLPKTQLCVWGLEVAARLSSMPSLPWFGCDAGAPSLSTVTVKVNGVVVPGVLTKHPYTCSGGGEGNLAFTKAVFGCP